MDLYSTVNGQWAHVDMKQLPETVIGVIGRLITSTVFEWRTSARSEAFSLFICLDANKFVLLSLSSLIKMIYPSLATKLNCPMMQKVYFRLMSVAQKRCCLSSLMFSGWQAESRFQALVRSCQTPPPSGSFLIGNLLLFSTHGKGNTIKCPGYAWPPTLGLDNDWCISVGGTSWNVLQ